MRSYEDDTDRHTSTQRLLQQFVLTTLSHSSSPGGPHHSSMRVSAIMLGSAFAVAIVLVAFGPPYALVTRQRPRSHSFHIFFLRTASLSFFSWKNPSSALSFSRWSVSLSRLAKHCCLSIAMSTGGRLLFSSVTHKQYDHLCLTTLIITPQLFLQSIPDCNLRIRPSRAPSDSANLGRFIQTCAKCLFTLIPVSTEVWQL